jgi:hypothetical protein
MIPIRTLAPALCLALAAAAATAQTGAPVARADQSPVARMNMAYTTAGFEYLQQYEGLLPPETILALAMVAKMKAIARSCDGFDIDEARYGAVMNDLLSPLVPAAGDGGTAQPGIGLPFAIGMTGYAMFLGGNIAVAAYDPEGFCAQGPILRAQLAEDGAPDLLIWADAD